MAIRRKSRQNFLSNHELCYMINESKKTYSYFVDDQYGDYSTIVDSIDSITEKDIEYGKQKKADDYNQALMRKIINEGYTKSEIDTFMDEHEKTADDFTKNDLVFRVMTYDHVPQDFIDVGQKTLLNRLRFPPFKHYAYINDELKEVGRSHWKDGLDNGSFCTDHGKISNDLAKAVMLMVDRYARRPNFKNYSYIEEMRNAAICQAALVMLQFNEEYGIKNQKQLNPFSYYTSIIHTSFIKILKIEKKQRDIRDEILQAEAGFSSFNYQYDDG